MALNERASVTGTTGENFTARYLTERGYQILDRTWRIREGELDVVALSPDKEIVFIVVKTRTSVA